MYVNDVPPSSPGAAAPTIDDDEDIMVVKYSGR